MCQQLSGGREGITSPAFASQVAASQQTNGEIAGRHKVGFEQRFEECLALRGRVVAVPQLSKGHLLKGLAIPTPVQRPLNPKWAYLGSGLGRRLSTAPSPFVKGFRTPAILRREGMHGGR